MSDYPLWAYREQLEHQAKQKLGYDNPFQDQKAAHAIKLAIDEKVQEFASNQEKELRNMVDEFKKDLL